MGKRQKHLLNNRAQDRVIAFKPACTKINKKKGLVVN